MTRRLSTRSFARRACDRIENGAMLAEAINHPAVREILETMDANDGARFFICACYQWAKSAIGQARMLRNHRVRSRPALWYGPSANFGKDFADSKLNPLADALPEICALKFIDDKTKTTKTARVMAGGASHRLLSAGTDGDRHGKTACDVYYDEPHLYESGWIKQISNRRGSYTNSERFTETFMSTGLTVGETQGGEAAKIWETTDKRAWHCRCPDCLKLFEPLYVHREIPGDSSSAIVGGLRYERKFSATGVLDEQAVAASLVYECPHCHAKRPDTAGTRTLYSGTEDAPTGEYVATNPTPSPRCFGWRFSAIALRPWLPIVLRFEEAQAARIRGDLEPLANCIREEFGDVWDPEKYHRPDRFDRYQHPTPYLMKEAWADEIKDERGEPFRFAKIDVQLDYFVLTIRKWGAWSQSRLHWFKGRVMSPSELALYLAEEKVPPHRTFMDCRYDPQRVRRICALMGWIAVMGDKAMKDYLHEDGIRRIYDQPKVMDAMSGLQIQKGGHRPQGACVEFLFSKNSALNRLALLRDPESKAPDGTPLWTAASDAPEEYFKQINAHFRKRVDNGDGTHHFVWHGQKDDHAGDCEAIGVVAASMARLTGAESLEPAQTEDKKP